MITRKLKEFRIRKVHRYDSYGNAFYYHSYIQQQVQVLWWKVWIDIKTIKAGYGGANTVLKTFSDEDRAEKYIKTVLCPDITRDTTTDTIVRHVVCNA